MRTVMESWGGMAVFGWVLWMGVCVGASGQLTTRNPGNYPPSPTTPSMNDPSDPHGSASSKAIQEKMAISRNDERQRKLVADTNQLFDLASKLKDDVDKTDKYTLSLDVIKRTAEIEKLAKSIRERMKD